MSAWGGAQLLAALGHALVAFLWQGMGVALAVAAVLSVTPRRAARVRYAVACLGLGVMAVLPVATFWSALDASAPEGLAAPGGLVDLPSVMAPSLLPKCVSRPPTPAIA